MGEYSLEYQLGILTSSVLAMLFLLCMFVRCVTTLLPWSSEREIIIAPIHTNNPRPLITVNHDDRVLVFETFGNKDQEGGAHGGGCAICLEEYKYGDALAGITACKHRYHVACIKAWLVKNDTCPICRSTDLV